MTGDLKELAMKKYLIIISALSILFLSGCYESEKNATVRINIGNLPIAKQVEKKSLSLIDKILLVFTKNAYAQTVPGSVKNVYLGVYEGEKFLTKLSLTVAEINAVNGIIDLTIPAGDNISIIVVTDYVYGEDQNSNPIYKTEYYGYITRDFKSGETSSVQINVTNIQTAMGLAKNNSEYYIYWNKMPGAEFTITDEGGAEIYKGTGTIKYLDQSTIFMTYYSKVHFPFIELSSMTF